MRESARKKYVMATQKTITINGRAYDAVTGLPVESSKASVTPSVVVPKRAPQVAPVTRPAVAPVAKVTTPTTVAAPKPTAKTPVKPVKPAAPTVPRGKAVSETVQGNVQKSKTLMRRAAKKPTAPQKIVRRTQPGKHMDFARNTNVAKFAPHPVVKEVKTASASPVKAAPVGSAHSAGPVDKPAQPHPSAIRALAKADAKKQAQVKAARPATSKEVKDAAIEKALSTPKTKAKKTPKNKWIKRGIIIGSCLLLVLVALFAVYKFIPSVSVSIAAAQAGIEARYPDFTPDGYSLNQPVTYADGEVNLTFKSNSNDSTYSINQKRSSWDSSATLDNVVIPEVGQNYATTKERGLTIYTYDKGAAWVNGGILYTISGDAQLSGDQIRRIATSL